MLFRALPFYDEDKKKTFKMIKEEEPDYSKPVDNLTEQCLDLMKRML
jgi:hypothetical protein